KWFQTNSKKERRDRSIEHLKRQLARRLALLAERDGHFQAATDERLVGLAGKADAEALVADASSERPLAATAWALQQANLDETILATGKDLERMRLRITHLESSVKLRQERLDILRSDQNRGTVNPFSLYQARTELVDIEQRQE